MRAASRGAVVGLVVGVLFSVFGGVALGQSTWRMAGTFNNWNTADEGWELEPHPDRSWEFRIERLIQPGVYRFKFVRNGDWGAGHFGSTEHDGMSLEQPGGDIELVVDGLAFYRITLDTQSGRWSREIARVERPIVSGWVYGDLRVGEPVLLDLSDTVAGSEPWELLVGYEYDASMVKVQRGGAASMRAYVVPLAPGRATIDISVRDGDEVGVAAVELEIERAVYAAVSLEGDDGATVERNVGLDEVERGVLRGFFALDDAAVLDGVEIEANGRRVARVGDRVELDAGVYEVRAIEGEDGGWSLVDAGDASGDGAWRGGLRRATNMVRFGYPAALPRNDFVRTVHLVGEFNGWAGPGASGSIELDRVMGEEGPAFAGWVELPDGAHEYAFVVDRVRRVADPSGIRVDGATSRVVVGDRPGDFAGVRRGGIVAEAVKHDARFGRYFTALSDGLGLVDLSVRALGGDARSARVVVERSGAEEMVVPMRRVRDASGFDFWSARVKVGGPAFTYRFELEDGDARVETERFGADLGALRDAGGFVDLPDWAKGAVYYQIFAERFRNGNPLNDPRRRDVFLADWMGDWYEVTTAEEAAWRARYSVAADEGFEPRQGGNLYHVVFDRRYGGDLQGVVEKLDYIRDLGVTAIYFNPVFEGRSMHKYDAADFRHIDDNFGTPASAGRVEGRFEAAEGDPEDPSTWGWTDADRYFVDVLLPEARERGIRVVIDGVWNHTGREFWAWRDVMEKGAASRYADWFYVEFDGSGAVESWVAWDGPSGWLPKFKQTSTGDLVGPVKRHLFAVTERWMDPNGDGDPSDGIDGWRLDVPLDVGLPFWEDWRRHVKSINPEAVIIAEIWSDGEADPLIRGDHFDTHMHYPFAHAVTDWLGVEPGMTSGSLGERLDGAFDDLPQTNLIHQNLMGSHDTDRYISMLINPGRGYDGANRPQDSGPGYVDVRPGAEVYARSLLGVAMQATHEGAPMVYYGDEVGMWGADDPTDRKPYPWPDLGEMARSDTFADQALLERYRAWFGLRRVAGLGDVLKYGDQRRLETGDDDVYAYERSLNGDRVVVIVNRGEDVYSGGRVLREVFGDSGVRRYAALDGGLGWRVVAEGGERLGLARVGRVDGVRALVWYMPAE